MKLRVKKTMAVAVLLGVCVSGARDALAAGIDQVVVRQRWPWSRLVDIDYQLSCDATQAMHVTVTACNGTEKLAIPLSSLSGDLTDLSEGAHRIVWDPVATIYTNRGALASFSVELKASAVPLYMIVDLTKAPGVTDQIAYVYESDLTNDVWGSWVRNPVTNNGTVIQSVIWTGVTNNLIYATDKLVLRRAPAGTLKLGNLYEGTRITKPCYAGVFAVTEAQWANVMGGSGTSSKPKTSVSYNDIRGPKTGDASSVDWPNTDRTVVKPSSFLGQLRAKTGIADFDLPTSAQWEYLCRAGTTSFFNDGNAAAKYNGTEPNNNGSTNMYLDVLGWYNVNCTEKQPVGLKVPNAWGLYDMHGNAFEWCLDWYFATFTGGDDPEGPVSGSARVKRGGNYINDAATSRTIFLSSQGPQYADTGYYCGLRLVRTLP